MPSYVYKYVLDKVIIYIGITKDLKRRISQHGKKGDNIAETAWEDINKSDVYYAECVNINMAELIESALINKYHPKYNKAKTQEWSGIPFIEPIWYFYKEKNDLTYDILHAEIYQLKATIKEKDKTIHSLENHYRYLQKELDNKKSTMCLCCDVKRELKDSEYIRMEQALNIESHDKGLINTEKGNAKTIDEIIQDYKDGYRIDYYSISYDGSKNIEFVKHIYSFKQLFFDFYGKQDKKISGSIMHTRQDETISNFQTLKAWNAKGSKLYYPISLIDVSIKELDAFEKSC